MKKPSEEGKDIDERQTGHLNHPHSPSRPTEMGEDLADPTTRGGALGSENTMPDGGDSTRFPRDDRESA